MQRTTRVLMDAARDKSLEAPALRTLTLTLMITVAATLAGIHVGLRADEPAAAVFTKEEIDGD